MDITINDLNNQGAAFLQAGDYQNAITRFAAGLTSRRRQLLQSPVGGRFLLVVEENRGIDYMMKKPAICHAEIDWSTTEHYVYGHPICFPILEDCDDGMQPVALSRIVMVSSILIWNCAITYHLFALKQSNNEALLQKAGRFYEHGFELQKDSGTGRWEYFALASLSNLGSVYRALGQKEKCATCFYELLACLSAASRTRNYVGLDIDESIYEVFFQSVLQSFLETTPPFWRHRLRN